MRKVNYKEMGITLIALVVTIIILLILAGVTLSTALSQNGLFQRAKIAGENYKRAEADETEKLGEVEKTIDELARGKVADRTGLKIGDTVNYTYDNADNYELEGKNSGYGEYVKNEDGTYKLDTEKKQSIAQVRDATWQVLSINDDGSVDLVCTSIAEDGADYFNQMMSGLDMSEGNKHGGVAFGGAIGYTNGVYYLNDICARQYSNNSLGVTARNIKIEDIEKHLNDSGRATVQQLIEVEGTKEYTGENVYYPKLYAYENGSEIDEKKLTTNGIGPSETEVSSDSSFQIPISHSKEEEGYGKAGIKLAVNGNFIQLVEYDGVYFDDNRLDDLLFSMNSGFWVASRFAFGKTPDDKAKFGLDCVLGNVLSGQPMFDSIGCIDRVLRFFCMPVCFSWL